VPDSSDARAQADVLTTVLAERPRAVLLQPVDYQAFLPYLRLAHDQGVFVVLLDEPPDPANPSFVVSFVSAPVEQVVRELAGRLTGEPVHGRHVLVVWSAASRSGAAIAAALPGALATDTVATSVLPRATASDAQPSLRVALAAHPDVTDLVLADAGAVAALRSDTSPLPRALRIVAATLGGVDDLVAAGRIDAAVGGDLCALTTAGMRQAVAAALNDAGSVRPRVDVPVRVLTEAAPRAVAC
jgi:ABC-type sugar transport system substrate-binding protein